MTEQEAKTLPLWEVWKEMDSIIRLSIPHIEKLASPDYRVDEAMRPIYANQLAECKEVLAIE